MAATPESVRRASRPHTFPPIPTWRINSDTGPSGFVVLFELADEDEGVALGIWLGYRLLDDWSRTRGSEYVPTEDVAISRLLSSAADAFAVASELEEFGLLLYELRTNRSAVSRTRAADTAHQVYEWAESRSHLRTATLYAELAAALDPTAPARANTAARMCRRTANHARATVWYERAFKLAIRHGNHAQALYAQLGYGSLMYGIGKHAEARRSFERAAKRAVRNGRLRDATDAHHDLLLLCAEVGLYRQAEWHAQLALRYYPVRYRRFPAFAHDFGFLLVQQGCFTPAWLLLEKLPRLMRLPDERTIVLSTVARAAAGAGRLERFHELEPEVEALVERHHEFSAAALLNLAEASYMLRNPEKALRLAHAAIRAARAREDTSPERLAQSLISRMEQSIPPQRETTMTDSLRVLLNLISARLRRWDVPRRDRPRRE